MSSTPVEHRTPTHPTQVKPGSFLRAPLFLPKAQALPSGAGPRQCPRYRRPSPMHLPPGHRPQTARWSMESVDINPTPRGLPPPPCTAGQIHRNPPQPCLTLLSRSLPAGTVQTAWHVPRASPQPRPSPSSRPRPSWLPRPHTRRPPASEPPSEPRSSLTCAAPPTPSSRHPYPQGPHRPLTRHHASCGLPGQRPAGPSNPGPCRGVV